MVAKGQVMVFPFGRLSGPTAMPQMFLNNLRREILLDILRRRARLNAPVVEGPAYLQPYCTGDGDRMYVYLVNGAMDPAKGWRLHMGGGGWRRAGLYFSDGRREEMEVSPDEESIAFPQALGVMETVLIALDKEQEDR